jgi:hypothetical protein
MVSATERIMTKRNGGQTSPLVRSRDMGKRQRRHVSCDNIMKANRRRASQCISSRRRYNIPNEIQRSLRTLCVTSQASRRRTARGIKFLSYVLVFRCVCVCVCGGGGTLEVAALVNRIDYSYFNISSGKQLSRNAFVTLLGCYAALIFRWPANIQEEHECPCLHGWQQSCKNLRKKSV